jgi:hypothetical protein
MPLYVSFPCICPALVYVLRPVVATCRCMYPFLVYVLLLYTSCGLSLLHARRDTCIGVQEPIVMYGHSCTRAATGRWPLHPAVRGAGLPGRTGSKRGRNIYIYTYACPAVREAGPLDRTGRAPAGRAGRVLLLLLRAIYILIRLCGALSLRRACARAHSTAGRTASRPGGQGGGGRSCGACSATERFAE